MSYRAQLATDYIKHFIGKWYKWGGDDPSGFDCSGLCVEVLKATGVLPRSGDWTAQGLHDMFIDSTVKKPVEGCLAFWYNSAGTKIIHVEYCVSGTFTIGASGGGSKTLAVADAVKANAFIKMRPIKEGAVYANPFKGHTL